MKLSRGRLAGLLGLAGFLVFAIVQPLSGLEASAQYVAGTAWLMMALWIGESLPIYVTAMAPLVIFPLLGVTDAKAVAKNYGDDTIMLMLGGFFLALALERWGLHRRISLRLFRLSGDRPRRLVLALMMSAALFSMWVSNTATTLMLLPIALALIAHLEERREKEPELEAFISRFAPALLLGIAYSASIGGVATPVGTPPNPIFLGQFHQLFPGGPAPSFLQWMLLGAPLAAVFTFLAWLYLTRWMFAIPNRPLGLGEALEGQLAPAGRMSAGERRVLAVFLMTALLWITRADMTLGALSLPGWSSLLPGGKGIGDGTVAILATMALFIVPAGGGEKGALVDWNDSRRIPWGVLILFGGGFALADAVHRTGMDAWLADVLGKVLDSGERSGAADLALAIIGVSVFSVFLSEVTSNTAMATLLMPLLASLSLSLGLHPFTLMLTSTFANSLAFMMPSGTPPNAVVFASGRLGMGQMVRAGFLLNWIGILLVALMMLFWAPMVLGYDPAALPLWAR